MINIGLFTIYIANYGAVLQTYALQRYIRDTYPNTIVKIIDFYSRKPYSIFVKESKNPIKNFLKQSRKLVHYAELKQRVNREKKFINEEFDLTKRYKNLDSFWEEVPDFDIYLTGSDQVFNLNSKYKKVFYQVFDKCGHIKAAYAPSFGTSTFTDSFKNTILKPISDFDYISCREDDGAEMLSEILKKQVPRVLDPTLLLTKSQWEQMMISPKSSANYVLVYDLNGGQRMIDKAYFIAQKMSCKVWCITQHTDIWYKNVDRIIYNAGPREFVGLFAKAQYVITDSFHGTVFSLLFEKKFNTYIAVEQSSRRIVSLLNSCGLQSRIINKDTNILLEVDCTIEALSSPRYVCLLKQSKDYINHFVSSRDEKTV